MTYDIKFRRKVLLFQKKHGLTNVEVCSRFDIGIASIVRWKTILEPKRSRNKPSYKIDMLKLEQDVKDYPDAYLKERAERFGVSIKAIYDALGRLGVRYKKQYNII